MHRDLRKEIKELGIIAIEMDGGTHVVDARVIATRLMT